MFPDRLTLPEAAEYIGVSEKTLYMWYEADRGPKAAKLAGRIWYLRSDIDEWANAEMAATTRGGVR
jgi:predicted DNA-binding transcriptional regulator AlpA